MSKTRPYHPSQLPTGGTYVVDGRTNKVVSNVTCSFDTAERWHVAKLRADRMNDEFESRFYAMRRRRTVVLVILLMCALAWGGVYWGLLRP